MLNSTSNYLLVLFINFSVEAKILPIMAKLILKSEGVKTVKILSLMRKEIKMMAKL